MAGDRRRRLADDTRRTIGLMAAVVADARRARAEVPDGVTASVTVWRSWAARLVPRQATFALLDVSRIRWSWGCGLARAMGRGQRAAPSHAGRAPAPTLVQDQ
jgi:hypothetical protein